jgi:anti-sigma B factor antagonist
MVPVTSLLVHRLRTLPVLLRILVGLGSIGGCGGERQQPRSDAIVSPENARERPRELDTANRHLRLESVGGVTVVTFVESKIVTEENIQEVGDQLYSLVEDEGHKNILLNFANVQYLSSAALGKLINLKKKVASVKGRLKLCCIHPDLLEVFRITRLDQVFEIYGDKQAALDDF